ncbi:MAG TPA: prephenate dehydrogenase dimerization domain-containing protein, partial [Candidatus Limnocylindrales bacterium]|nr:prephenate dehydrogenase dimerization domain-containing protein [Candidatus Limnocylindrales bacterium]
GDAAPDDAELLRRLAATGWRDMTRLARGDAAMGAGILATNAPAIAERLRAFRDRIDEWLAIVEAEEGIGTDAVRRRLDAARDR